MFLGLLHSKLFDFVNRLYIKNKIQEYYRSPEFTSQQKKFSLWLKDSQFERTLYRFPCDDEIVRKVEPLMVIHVTKKINMDAIALKDWVLEQNYPNSKQ